MSLKQKIQELFDHLEEEDWTNEDLKEEVCSLLDKAIEQIKEKAFCSLLDFKPPVKIAYTQDLDIVSKNRIKNEPYLVAEFDPCRNRKCATCEIRTQHLTIKLSEILFVLGVVEAEKQK